MKRTFLIIAAAMMLCPMAFAQMDEREPGIYTINSGESVPLKFEISAQMNDSMEAGELSVLDSNTFIFSKPSAKVTSESGEFVLVINPEKKMFIQTLKKYDVFIGTMSPENMILIPLSIHKNKKRIYHHGSYDLVHGLNISWDKKDFTWEKISDNSFRIKAELEPGEYAFAFRINKLQDFQLNAVYTFSVK